MLILREKNVLKYLIILFEVTLLIYFISVRFIYKIWNDMYFGSSYSIYHFCLLLSFVSNIMLLINIKCNSKTKKQLFVIFAMLGLLAILGIIIFYIWYSKTSS